MEKAYTGHIPQTAPGIAVSLTSATWECIGMYVYSDFSEERADYVVRMINSTDFFETSITTYNPRRCQIFNTYNGNK